MLCGCVSLRNAQRIEDIRDSKHLLHILYLVHETLMRTKPSDLDPQLWGEVMESLVPRYCELAGSTRDKENLRKVRRIRLLSMRQGLWGNAERA